MEYLRQQSSHLLSKINSRQRWRRFWAVTQRWTTNICYLFELGLTASHFAFIFGDTPLRQSWQTAVTSIQLLIAIFLWVFQPRERSLSNYLGVASLKRLQRRVAHFYHITETNQENPSPSTVEALRRELEQFFQEVDTIELLDHLEGLLRHARSSVPHMNLEQMTPVASLPQRRPDAEYLGYPNDVPPTPSSIAVPMPPS